MKELHHSYAARLFTGSVFPGRFFFGLLLAAGILSHASGVCAKTLGFAVTAWKTSVYESPNLDECPDGLAIGNDEIWWTSLTPQKRNDITYKGIYEPIDEPRRTISIRRGPNGEDVCWRTDLVKDPPLRTVQGKISYGQNLDGTDDGRATPNTCAHEKFTTLDGARHIDNQMYRVVGCIYGWRKGLYVEDHNFIDKEANRQRLENGKGILLVEITGVDDPMNSPDVQVHFYGNDSPLTKDDAGKVLPLASYHPSATQHYGAVAHGRIADGVLITDPVDARLPLYGHDYTGDMFIRGLRLNLKIAPDGEGSTVKGTIAGYYDLNSWVDYLRKIENSMRQGEWDCPAVYEAATRLADGYPDPKTGHCTALSTSMEIEAQPAFIIHPKGQEKTASNGNGNKTAQASTETRQVR